MSASGKTTLSPWDPVFGRAKFADSAGGAGAAVTALTANDARRAKVVSFMLAVVARAEQTTKRKKDCLKQTNVA